MEGLYNGLNVDYDSHLLEDFGTLISHMKLAIGVSRARFLGLILKEIYTQGNIVISMGIDTA